MAEPLDPKEIVSIEELTISNMYEIEALIEVLARKGLNWSQKEGTNMGNKSWVKRIPWPLQLLGGIIYYCLIIPLAIYLVAYGIVMVGNRIHELRNESPVAALLVMLFLGLAIAYGWHEHRERKEQAYQNRKIEEETGEYPDKQEYH